MFVLGFSMSIAFAPFPLEHNNVGCAKKPNGIISRFRCWCLHLCGHWSALFLPLFLRSTSTTSSTLSLTHGEFLIYNNLKLEAANFCARWHKLDKSTQTAVFSVWEAKEPYLIVRDLFSSSFFSSFPP